MDQAACVIDLFAADFPSAGSGDASGDSLREFQLKNAGGLLGGTDWPELEQKVHDCTECKLRQNCTQTVFGTGDIHARWLFVGEAPGAEEDERGEPFVGASGRLLDNMLMAIGLKRSEVYIANVIKCRPVDDRHPHVGEIAACLPYLKRQIGLLQPAVIVALGKTAASALLETDATIASMRGSVHDYKGIPLVVTYHPAYLLRSPLEKARAWQDLSLALKIMTPV
ncbi:MAG: uracil-DNA glycosylase [Nitrosomonadales bacterium]